MSKRRSDASQDRPLNARSQSRFQAFLLSIMGPASIGENKAPEGFVPDEAASLCPKCHQPWDDHGRVHSDNMTYRPCPPAQR